MKYLVGFILSLCISLLITFINEKYLKTPISDFMVGWLSCIAFYAGKELYQSFRQTED